LHEGRTLTKSKRGTKNTKNIGRYKPPIGDRHVGGYDDLVELDLEGELESLLC